jgi:hypothetical protein
MLAVKQLQLAPRIVAQATRPKPRALRPPTPRACARRSKEPRAKK